MQGIIPRRDTCAGQMALASSPRATATPPDAGGGSVRSSAPLEPDDDAFLLRRCRKGDMDAFGILVSRHESRVRSLVARILGPSASADDLDDTTQDVFVQAWRALSRFRGDSRFSTWLYRVATNIAIKQWHRRKRGANVVAEAELPESVRVSLADPSPGPSASAERRSRDRELRTAIESLPEKQRTVILLHYYEEYTCEEMALIVGCSVGTIWSRLHYGCRKLRESLAWLDA
jgi:RNA polymerase sigma-70 factor (ECF subfamily)